MAYDSDTIATVVQQLNRKYFLPAIQREFVWGPDQIIELFDSIMRNYPISSFLFWDLKPATREDWDVYKFVEHAHEGGSHNEITGTEGISDLTLVLDGQQRLTSLLVGLRGTYTVRRKRMRKSNPSAYDKRGLYIDLLKDARAGDEEGLESEARLRYSFRWRGKHASDDEEHYWFKVGKILDFDSEEAFYEFRQRERDRLPEKLPREMASNFELNIDRLYRAFWKDEIVAYYTERDQDPDRVLDIFVRANEGGTPLSKSDLLLSMVTSKWTGTNAREEIYGFVDHLNSGLAQRNDFSKDFVMKSSLVLSGLSVEYKIKNFTPANLETIRTNWDQMKVALERAVTLVNTFGLDRDTLTSANAVIPIAYYLFKKDRDLLGTSREEAEDRRSIQQWLISSLLNRVFSGSADRILREARRVIDEGDAKVFPAEHLNVAIRKMGRTSGMNEASVDNALALRYGGTLTFMALSLLYDETAWGSTTQRFQQDHIFPKSRFSDERLQKAGIPQDRWKLYQRLVDTLPNLQLLSPRENQSKSDQDFEEWLTSRDDSFLQRHLIPTDRALLKLERFPEFVVAREILIRERFHSLFEIREGEGESDDEHEHGGALSALADVEFGRGTFESIDWELFVEQGVGPDRVKLAREIATRVNDLIRWDGSWEQTGWLVRWRDVNGTERVAVTVSSPPRVFVNAVGIEQDPWPHLKGKRNDDMLWWGMARPELVPDDFQPIAQMIQTKPPR